MTSKMYDSLPIVDFAKAVLGSNSRDEDLVELGDEIYHAFANFGFVYLKNTGITREQIDAMYAKSQEFYDLDFKTKMKYAQNSTLQGYLGIEDEILNKARPGDIKEAFDIRGYCMEDDEANWPDVVVPGFSTKVREFVEICRQLSMRLLKVIAIGMKMKDKKYFMKGHSRINKQDNYSSLRILHYPPLPDDLEIKPKQVRLGEHTDFGSITLLFQDHVGGLEVQSYDGKFIEATPIPDTIVVNIGDAMNYWSKGKLKSTVHRIVIPDDAAKRKVHRKSMAFLAHPDFEVILLELECGIKETSIGTSVNNHDNEKPVTAYEHAKRMYSDTLGDITTTDPVT